jgi:hypothetical protein
MSATIRLCAELHATQEAAAALRRRAARLEVRLLDDERCEDADLTEAVLPLRAALHALNDAATNLGLARAELVRALSADEARP